MPLSRIDPSGYEKLLEAKAERIRQLFAEFEPPALAVYHSPELAYRMRAEFRLWHEGDDLYYAMFRPADPKTPVRIKEFPVAAERIQRAMPLLLEQLRPEPVLRRKLFQVEFLSTLSGELLVTLIYHRPLDEDWKSIARTLGETLNAHVIGRSRKQKEVLTRDFVTERLPLPAGEFEYRQYEQGFTQPNARVNVRMIEWACEQAARVCGGDLLELYCGNGNFTLPLSHHYATVIATEVAKSSIRAALHNCEANAVENVHFIRLAAEEVCEALDGVREFRRLRELPQALGDYDFSTVFVDPPRAGLDPLTEQLVSRFENIIYISCNPDTLRANLAAISDSHSLQGLAIFDQFPYTDHVECGAFLVRKPV